MIYPELIPPGAALRRMFIRNRQNGVALPASTKLGSTTPVSFANLEKYMPKTAIGSVWIQDIEAVMEVEDLAGGQVQVPSIDTQLQISPAQLIDNPDNFPYPIGSGAGVFNFNASSIGVGRLGWMDLPLVEYDFSVFAWGNNSWFAPLGAGPYEVTTFVSFSFWAVLPPVQPGDLNPRAYDI